MWKGFMPGLMQYTEPQSILLWWEGYVMTYLERDLRQLSQIESLADFRRLMTACALRCGKIINQTEVSRDTGISQPTVHRYMNLLEITHLMTRVPAYAVNRTKRLMKSPKLIWTDPGLAAFLAGFYDTPSLSSSDYTGSIFESMIYLHLHVLTQLMIPRARIYFWRTTTGKEVDFVILENKKPKMFIECKLRGREINLLDKKRRTRIGSNRILHAQYS
jgi:predicted AAA+ superfamily ATPase